MCGIAAAIDVGLAPRQLLPSVELMNDLIAHRGPDGSGLWERRAGRRRARPPAPRDHRPRRRAHQPMTDGDGAWITYNGEIYNYVELREELGEASLPHGLRHRGRAARLPHAGASSASSSCAACSPSRSGTRREQTLFCARDRFGIKPLYYAQVDGVLYWPPRPRRCCRSCPTSRPTPRGCRTTSPSSSSSTATRCSAESRSSCPATTCWCATATRRPALLGGPVRAGLRPHRALLLGAPRGARADSVRLHLRADVPVGAYVSRRSRLRHRRRARRATSGRPVPGLHGAFRRRPGLRREPLRPRPRGRARLRAARGRRSRPRTSSASSATSSTTSTSRSPARAPSRSTSCPARGEAREGGARRAGRRRDLRRLRALPIAYFEQCIKAAIEGTADGQLRRHVRVDHPEPGDAARVQAAAVGVLARRAVRGPRPALLPARRPRPAAGRRHRPGRVRRRVAATSASTASSEPRTCARSRTSTR